jgi:N-hydroxyarylamine O-acetyltransferase
MDTFKYLQRINYIGEIRPSLQVLSKLQKAHLLHIPFENLDIIAKIPIELIIEKLYNKIVLNNHGGFCYELNGLFFELLKKIGFEVKMVSARVYNKNKGYGAEFDHMAIIVRIKKVEYLTDVGFGEFAFTPIKIEMNTVQEDRQGKFKIEKYDENYFLVSKHDTDKWIPEYIFSSQSRELKEYVGMCNYHQTSPDSHFTWKRICSLPTEKGRITITGNTLKITSQGKHTEKHIESEMELKRYLQEFYNIKLD